MRRLLLLLFLTPPLLAQAQDKPITTAKSPLGELLRKWQAEGTAAGNVGDWYDNRDGDHSPLNRAPWPQLSMVKYTPEDLKLRKHWAAQRALLPYVTFGNSSTSAPPLTGGSNIRMYYTQPRGIDFLYQQYRKSNLYIYPEHRDHDRRAEGGYGDLYPTNTPFLIASQGSSGSDQPFMRMMPYTLAAFRPDVKKKLVETGLLMPTIQMIFRKSNKHLTDSKEYLTGKAHPTVFEGSWVNDLKMAQLAHDITIDSIPPLVQLKVVEETLAEQGKDFFEPAGRSEKLADTPAVIARIVRGPQQLRRLVVSAEDSADVNQRNLKFHWSVLRGDAKRITIQPLNEAGSKVELRVPYHDRFTAGPVPIETSRVDIGCFVHNGVHWSAPGFVTFQFLDNEARSYDDQGRLLEVAYGAGQAELAVSDWNALFDLLKNQEGGLPRDLCVAGRKPEELAVIHHVGEEYRAASAKHAEAQAMSKSASTARQKLSPALKAADEKFRAALQEQERTGSDAALETVFAAGMEYGQLDAERRAADAQVQQTQRATNEAARAAEGVLTQQRPGLSASVRDLALGSLRKAQQQPDFFLSHRQVIAALAGRDPAREARLDAARKAVVAAGVLVETGGAPELQSIRAGDRPAAERLTRFERQELERFHAELLAGVVYPGIVSHTFRSNVTDPRITTPKNWRDIYHHDKTGQIIGWTRHQGGKATDYQAEGHIVLEKDEQGRPTKCRSVRYEIDDPKKGLFAWSVKPVAGNEVLHYEYAGPEDRKGKVVKREAVKGD